MTHKKTPQHLPFLDARRDAAYHLTMRAFWSLFLVGAVALFVSGCGQEPVTLVVDVVTDLVPGPEFNLVETDVLTYANQKGAIVTNHAVGSASYGQPYSFGKQVARFTNLSRGDHEVRVRLRSTTTGEVLIARTVRFVMPSNYVLRVYMERSCLHVECPGSAPAGDSECQGGQCVDPRCNPADPATSHFCAITFCQKDTDCGAVSACATRNCEQGICIPTAIIPSECNSDEWCNDVLGCVPNGTSTSTNDCGDICTEPGRPCSIGYWDCTNGGHVCRELLRRPVGDACGSNQVCAETGACVTCLEGHYCRNACTIGTIDCSTGVAGGECVPSTPPTLAAPGAHCTAGTVCLDEASCTGAFECDETGSCVDPSMPGISVSRTTGLVADTTGNSIDHFTVTLTGIPTANVDVTLAVAYPITTPQAPGGIVLTNAGGTTIHSLTFTPSNSHTAQTVNVVGAATDQYFNSLTFNVTLTGAVSSADTNYRGKMASVMGVYTSPCPSPTADCDNDVSTGCEANLATDGTNCGACGTNCAALNSSCSAGTCSVCLPGFEDCDVNHANGCELATGGNCTADLTNGGCKGGTEICIPGDTPDLPGTPACNYIPALTAPPGQICEVTKMCDGSGECAGCDEGAPCVPTGNPCEVGAISCATHAATGGTCVGVGMGQPVNTLCGPHSVCAPSGRCIDTLIATRVICGETPVTGDDICTTATPVVGEPSYTKALAAQGYWWIQCGGPVAGGSKFPDGSPAPADHLPGSNASDPCLGWDTDGLTCIGGFCGSFDCSNGTWTGSTGQTIPHQGMPFCYNAEYSVVPGWGAAIHEKHGVGSAVTFAADDYHYCPGWNPGWYIRALCGFPTPP